MKNLLYFILVMLLATACNEMLIQDPTESVDELTLVDSYILEMKAYKSDLNPKEMNAKVRKQDKKRPYKLTTEGTIKFTPGGGKCTQSILEEVYGVGNASHLGKNTIEISYCTNGLFPLTPVMGVQTAANGDKLFTYLAGVGEDFEGFFMEYVYYEGTGRFEGATGYVKLYPTIWSIDENTLGFTNYGSGWLRY